MSAVTHFASRSDSVRSCVYTGDCARVGAPRRRHCERIRCGLATTGSDQVPQVALALTFERVRGTVGPPRTAGASTREPPLTMVLVRLTFPASWRRRGVPHQRRVLSTVRCSVYLSGSA